MPTNNEPANLRAHLLNAEPPDPNRRDKLQKEIQMMMENRLSRNARIGWIVSLIGSICCTGWGLLITLGASLEASLRIIWIIYTLANVLWAGQAMQVLRLGRFDRKLIGRMIAMTAGFALLISIVLFWRAAAEPTMSGILWAIFGVTCVMIDYAWILHYRISMTELTAKENSLRLELLLLEVKEKLDAKGEQAI